MAEIRVVADRRHAFTAELEKILERTLNEIGNDCLAESNKIVPLEEGTLQGSGFVEVQKTAAGHIEAQVAYGTPYAVKQHEDSTLKHDNGREDHYLEKTVAARTSKWEQYMADKVRNAT